MYSLQNKINKQEQPPLWQQYTPVVSLPTVSMVSLSSMRSWALGMSMCMRSVCCCLLIGSAGRVFLLRSTKQKRTSLSQVPVVMNSQCTMLCAYWDEVVEHSYLMSISAKLFASAKQTESISSLAEDERIAAKLCHVWRCSHLTSEPLQPLLSPPSPQHQQPDEDYNNAHQHTGNGHHHLQTFTATRVVLTHIGCLHQWCDGTCAEVIWNELF